MAKNKGEKVVATAVGNSMGSVYNSGGNADDAIRELDRLRGHIWGK